MLCVVALLVQYRAIGRALHNLAPPPPPPPESSPRAVHHAPSNSKARPRGGHGASDAAAVFLDDGRDDHHPYGDGAETHRTLTRVFVAIKVCRRCARRTSQPVAHSAVGSVRHGWDSAVVEVG